MKNRISKSGIPLAVFIILQILFTAYIISGRFLVSSQQGMPLTGTGIAMDLVYSLILFCAGLFINRLSLITGIIFYFLFTLLHLANMEMALALDTYIHLKDLSLALTGTFMKTSASHLSFPVYSLIGLALIVPVSLGNRKLSLYSGKMKLGTPAVSVVLLGLILFFLAPGTDILAVNNSSWLSLSRSTMETWQNMKHNRDRNSESGSSREFRMEALNDEETASLRVPVLQVDNTEESNRLVPPAHGNKSNLLIFSMEGIPGIYLESVQLDTGIKSEITMKAASRWAQQGLVIPWFAAHNRQTIRGLYSMLAGDYSKLSLETPKVYEYLSLPEEDRPLLMPAILRKNGYNTAYIQAADLTFMSKDQFMPAAGFSEVLGKDYFTWQYQKSNWGPDDKAFFEQILPYIDNLEKEESPWYLHLLTVGTHHPYAIPEDWNTTYATEKEAAIAQLDEALDQFLTALKERGLRENTLILITSDESHGVKNHPLGRFWGTAFFLIPEHSEELINEGYFGLKDIPRTVCTFLGYPEYFPSSQDMMSKQEKRPSLLFESWMMSPDGTLYNRLGKNRVDTYRAENGALFAASYRKEKLTGEEARTIAAFIAQNEETADSSVILSSQKNRNYLLLNNNHFTLSPDEVLLSTGQYLDIPSRTEVVLNLKAHIEPENDEINEEAAAFLRLKFHNLDLEEKNLPGLKQGNSLEWTYRFYSEEGWQQVWTRLGGRTQKSKKEHIVIDEFSVTTILCNQPFEPEEQTRIIPETGVYSEN